VCDQRVVRGKAGLTRSFEPIAGALYNGIRGEYTVLRTRHDTQLLTIYGVELFRMIIMKLSCPACSVNSEMVRSCEHIQHRWRFPSTHILRRIFTPFPVANVINHRTHRKSSQVSISQPRCGSGGRFLQGSLSYTC
jgi:hypothetical protein